EDGIRDRTVTGVQTCALPIFGGELSVEPGAIEFGDVPIGVTATQRLTIRNHGAGSVALFAPRLEGAAGEELVLEESLEDCGGKQIGRASCRERVERAGLAGES